MYKKKSREELKALANRTAAGVADAFRAGDVPAKLAPTFLRRKDVPCQHWSWSNKLLAALAGHYDARTFNGWKAVKRSVKKGEKAFYVLEPIKAPRTLRDAKGNDDKVFITVGFKATPRFGLSQTEGEPIDQEYDNWIAGLPLR